MWTDFHGDEAKKFKMTNSKKLPLFEHTSATLFSNLAGRNTTLLPAQIENSAVQHNFKMLIFYYYSRSTTSRNKILL